MIYHTRSQGVDIEAFKRGLSKAIDLAKSNDVDLIYSVPTLNQIKSDAAIEVLGGPDVQTLFTKRKIELPDLNIHVETKRNKSTISQAVFFALYLSVTDLKNLLTDHRALDVVFVPWSEIECNEFEAEHPNSVPI